MLLLKRETGRGGLPRKEKVGPLYRSRVPLERAMEKKGSYSKKQRLRRERLLRINWGTN